MDLNLSARAVFVRARERHMLQQRCRIGLPRHFFVTSPYSHADVRLHLRVREFVSELVRGCGQRQGVNSIVNGSRDRVDCMAQSY